MTSRASKMPGRLPMRGFNYQPDASMEKIHGFPLRVSEGNPNHHLWNNNGIWWLHYTVYPTAFTSERVRKSLRTRSLELARQRRDRLFGDLEASLKSA